MHACLFHFSVSRDMLKYRGFLLAANTIQIAVSEVHVQAGSQQPRKKCSVSRERLVDLSDFFALLVFFFHDVPETYRSRKYLTWMFTTRLDTRVTSPDSLASNLCLA